MPLKPVSLDDKYDLGQSRVFVSGFQALVRLTLMQKERDRRRLARVREDHHAGRFRHAARRLEHPPQ